MSGEDRSPKPRFKAPQLWDDQEFRKRMAQLASKRGISVRSAMIELGLTGEFAYRDADTRSTNLLMYLANYFQVSPAQLAGWAPLSDEQAAPVAPPQENELVTKLAEIFSQQTLKMLFITLAVVRPELDPASIAALARVARQGFQNLEEDEPD